MKVVEIKTVVTHKEYYERCSLHKHLGRKRDENCPDDCWVKVSAKPGKKTNHWGRDACRAKMNRMKEANK